MPKWHEAASCNLALSRFESDPVLHRAHRSMVQDARLQNESSGFESSCARQYSVTPLMSRLVRAERIRPEQVAARGQRARPRAAADAHVLAAAALPFQIARIAQRHEEIAAAEDRA